MKPDDFGAFPKRTENRPFQIVGPMMTSISTNLSSHAGWSPSTATPLTVYTGRYTQRDPLRSSTKLYSYAGDNPISWIDPLGLIRVKYNVSPPQTRPMGLKDGCTRFSLVNFSHTCKQVGCNTKTGMPYWKLEFELEADFSIFLGGHLSKSDAAETYAHELEHVGVAEANINSALSNVLPYEKRSYESQLGCEAASRLAMRDVSADAGRGQAGVAGDYIGHAVSALLRSSCP